MLINLVGVVSRMKLTYAMLFEGCSRDVHFLPTTAYRLFQITSLVSSRTRKKATLALQEVCHGYPLELNHWIDEHLFQAGRGLAGSVKQITNKD